MAVVYDAGAPCTMEPTMTDPKLETATLGGGCFWCTEAVFLEVEGVVAVESGYANGHALEPSYEQVCGGETGHAEVIRVRFDPQRIGYRELLEIFFATHDPTTPNRQGNDVGTQYRSAIFYRDEAQRRVAEPVKREIDASGKWPAPVVTAIVAAGPFYPAEVEHQDYLQRNPNGYTCHYLRD